MNKTSLLGPVSIPVRRRRTLFLPGVRLRNYKVLNQKKKKISFALHSITQFLSKVFLEKGIAGQWLSCFHMAVTITVPFVFFPGKIITFSIYFPPWYGFLIVLNGCIISHLDGPGVAYADKHWASVYTCWTIFQIVPLGLKKITVLEGFGYCPKCSPKSDSSDGRKI